MGRNIAIVVGAGLIALAIMVTNHWTINTPADGVVSAARLNRWTGQIDLCWIDPKSLAGANSLAGGKVECERK
jgi:hypothetical protein